VLISACSLKKEVLWSN